MTNYLFFIIKMEISLEGAIQGFVDVESATYSHQYTRFK